MELTFYRSDEPSMVANYYYKPEELISFHDLLYRWPMCSYYTIPFFTVLRRKAEEIGFYLHLFRAESIAFRKSPGIKQTDAETLIIKVAWLPPFYFRIHYEDLYADFDLLYFRLSQVEEIERAYPECLITDPEIIAKDWMNETSKRNIRKVAALSVWRMAACDLLPVEKPNTFIEGYRNPDHSAFWTGTREDESFRIPYFPDILRDKLGADIPVTIPERAKKKRSNNLEDIKPVIKTLRNMGVRVDKKCAKIIYSLYPHLTQEEIGALFPAKSNTKRSNATDRDRGRVLLGLKPSSKPPQRKAKPTT